MTTPELDKTQIEEFAGRLFTAINGAGVTILLSIGHQTGLFDTLATLPPSTSQQIADATGLNERYVREWLNGMVVSRIVEYTPAGQTYALPQVHAALLTRAAGNHNIAAFTPMLPMCGSVETAVVESFRNGGGVPYSAFPTFGGLMADIAASSNVEENLDHPLGPMFYAVSISHCMTVSLALGGEGLGNMWGEQTSLEYLAGAGFTDVTVKRVEGDIINNFYICSK